MEDVLQMALATPLVPAEEFSAERLWSVVQRAATNDYLEQAEAMGLFKGREGRELLGRIQANDARSYRGAMAECITAWWLRSALRLPLLPRPRGVERRVLEFAIATEPPVGVEVKAPFRPRRYPSGQVFMKDPEATDHIGAVVTCLGDAHQKFDPAQQNVVVLVPSLDWDVLRAVIRALEEGDLAIDAVMLLDTQHDFINPTRRKGGEAFVLHGCRVVRNRRRNPPPDSLWGGWPVYEGPDFQYWKKLSPVSGTTDKPWVRTSSVRFKERMLVPVPV